MKAVVAAFNQDYEPSDGTFLSTSVETADCDQIRHEVDHGRGENCLVTTAFIVRPTAEAAPSPRRDDYLIE